MIFVHLFLFDHKYSKNLCSLCLSIYKQRVLNFAQVLGLGSSGILGSTTLAGGFGSYIAGGDLINGASTGFSIGLLNHLGKRPQDDKDIAYTIELGEVDIHGKSVRKIWSSFSRSHVPIEKPLEMEILNLYVNLMEK